MNHIPILAPVVFTTSSVDLLKTNSKKVEFPDPKALILTAITRLFSDNFKPYTS
jgi:hypothetical protein